MSFYDSLNRAIAGKKLSTEAGLSHSDTTNDGNSCRQIRFTQRHKNLSSAAPALPKPQPVLALTSSRPSRPPQPWGKHPHSAQPSKQRQRTSSSEAPEAWQASASSKASTHRLARASSNDQACSKSTGHPSNRNSDGQSTSATKHTARNSRTCRTVCARPPTKAQRDAMRRTLIDMSGPSVAFRPGTSPRFVGQYSGRSEAQSEAQELRGMA